MHVFEAGDLNNLDPWDGGGDAWSWGIEGGGGKMRTSGVEEHWWSVSSLAKTVNGSYFPISFLNGGEAVGGGWRLCISIRMILYRLLYLSRKMTQKNLQEAC